MLEVKNVTCRYKELVAVKDVTLTANVGEVLCIVGPNGSGKTTLLKAIANVTKYDGNIQLSGRDLKVFSRNEVAQNIALLSQNTSTYFNYTVFETVMIARYPYSKGLFRSKSRRDVEVVLRNLKKFGLSKEKNKSINELSGGQFQRVLLARANAQETDVVLLDEPTNHLDLKHQIEMLEHFKKWAKENKKIAVTVLHDLTLAQKYADKVALLDGGELVGYGTPSEVLSSDRINKTYGLEVKKWMLEAYGSWI